MPIIFLYLLKVNVLALALYGYYHYFLRDKAILRWNRYYLLSIVPVSAGAPLLGISLPVPQWPASHAAPLTVRILSVVAGPGEAEPGSAHAIAAGLRSFSWERIGTPLYMLPAIILIGILIIQIFRLTFLRRRASAHHVDRAVLLETDAPGTPFSFFRWIFWDRRLDTASSAGRQVLRHELAHVHLLHSLDKLVIQVACAVGYPVLAFYLVRKEIQLVHEYEADRRASGLDIGSYAMCLVGHVLGAPPYALTQGFRGHSLTRRIAMLNITGRDHRMRKYLALPFAIGLSALFAFRPARPTSGGVALHPLTVVIDPGHGGLENGAQIHGILEKNLTLQLARTLAWLAPEYPSLRVVLTRYRDTTLSLNDRVALARKAGAGLFVSLHVNFRARTNETPDPSFSGVEAYVSGANPEYDSSLVLGSLLLQGIGRVYKASPQLMQRSVGIRVLGSAPCPATLLECGYMTNPGDLAWITNTDSQQELARSILRSLSAYAAGKAERVPVEKFKGTQR